ncbi:hypothetical protein AXG93_868s1460 [Marchantia polymorpha subsp. ruderalis]|uniref:Uncharacterized protein n=1 Tax=Marchantia polymorpha subsp. ruderalis TaxID=1480154 RepID=A0A176VK17_MARPO|nr:hypothetical protein AXG93_868s1460 [Marchantia polymorpha subsp. ruderalis]
MGRDEMRQGKSWARAEQISDLLSSRRGGRGERRDAFVAMAADGVLLVQSRARMLGRNRDTQQQVPPRIREEHRLLFRDSIGLYESALDNRWVKKN